MSARRALPFGIPDESTIQDPYLRSILSAHRANLKVAFGESGLRGQRFITVDDAMNARGIGFDEQDRMFFTANRKKNRGSTSSSSSSSASSQDTFGNVTRSLVGDVATFTLSVLPVGVYVVRFWLSDDSSGALSTTLPDVSGVVDWGDVLTDASGIAVFEVEHTGVHTWYDNFLIIGPRDGGNTPTAFT